MRNLDRGRIIIYKGPEPNFISFWSQNVCSGPELNYLYEDPEPYYISYGAGAEL